MLRSDTRLILFLSFHYNMNARQYEVEGRHFTEVDALTCSVCVQKKSVRQLFRVTEVAHHV